MGTAVWLQNKIGSDDAQWNSSSITSHFTTSVLSNIYDCFLQLEVKAKIKILLSILEIPLHSIKELQKSISEIVNLAESDPDEWVRVAANIVKDYPSQHAIDKRLENVTNSFQGTVTEIKEKLESVPPSNSLATVPLEAPYLNKVALNQMVPNQPTHMKHFTLRRRPKSAELRAKITQKALDAANQRKVTQSPVTPASKSLKRTNSLSTGKLPPVSHAKSISKTSLLPKKTKLLDIDNLPIGMREQKKRKKLLALEGIVEDVKPKKSHVDKSKSSVDEEEDQSHTEPTYPAGENKDADNITPRNSLLPPKQEDSESGNASLFASSQALTTPSYAVLPGTTPSLPSIDTVPRFASNIQSMDPNLMQSTFDSTEAPPVLPQMNREMPPPIPSINEQLGGDPLGGMMSNGDSTSGGFEGQSLQRELQMRVQKEHEFRLQQEQQFNQQLFQQHARQYGTNIPMGAPGSLNSPANMVNSGGITGASGTMGGTPNNMNANNMNANNMNANNMNASNMNANNMNANNMNANNMNANNLNTNNLNAPGNMGAGMGGGHNIGGNTGANMVGPGNMGLPQMSMQGGMSGMAVPPQTPPQQKKGLSLTREQMLAAQEMFRSANRVTRAEKALILGFMAGARDNPFPQQGPVITIKLSEDSQEIQNAEGPQSMVIEMLFEMNYDTGHWRRLKRTKVVSQQQPT